MDEGDGRYGIEELAERGGVTRRTVRYYVQRGLLPTPTGLGRGKHYTEAHLARLIQIRELQEAGVALAEIPATLDGVTPPEPPRDEPVQSTWTRLEVEEGVELFVRGRRLTPRQVEKTVRAIQRALGEET